MKLASKNIILRALEPEDLAFLFKTENDTSFWEVSGTQTPFSKFILKQYLSNAHQDIYEAKQLRLVIESNENPIGMIDLFDFDFQHKRAGIGILMLPQFQKKGFANEALELVIDYAFDRLNLHQLFANITSDNTKSIALFQKNKFTQIGVKKEWLFSNGSFKDEIMYQLLSKKSS